MSELDPRFTFETFVVGPANRLASAAARRAADSPGTSYNPLFLYSASGLGKSHILGAIAHHVERADPDLRCRYQTLESYLEGLTTAIQTGRKDELREEYRDLDLLLLDDVQFLAGQAEAQEMILVTLDALSSQGSQIVLASDRPPVEINGLDSRLVSRFSGGLMVDIAPPEFETRVAIIRRKAEEAQQALEPGVAEALARRRYRNVRELMGALNRVLAVQELDGRRLAPEDVPGLLGPQRPEDESGAPPAPMDEALGSFLDEVSSALSQRIGGGEEEPWRRQVREAADQADRAGFDAAGLRALVDAAARPPDWEDRLAGFRHRVARLREIRDELDRLDNPWREAAGAMVRDPERMDEAEAFLASARERARPFPLLSPGPGLQDLADRMPTVALRAAEQLASAARPQYNPLYLWSPESGPSEALLAAVGRDFREAFPGERVAVTSVSEFAEDFIRALSEGVAGPWRERWWTVDLLLVHGAQELSGTERAQDEFFHLFEALKRRGARVLLAADRPPDRIDGIDDRLRSRFEGGLVLEVEAPELPEGAGSLATETPPEIPPVRGVWEPHPDGPGRVDPDAGPRPPAAGDDAPWAPTREKVVWAWTPLEDRLLEELG